VSPELTPESANNTPFFFLSYAHTPKTLDPSDKRDPDRWVRKLYNDLSHAINQFSDSHSVGFMDQQIGLGNEWREDIAEALAKCRVFVPLYSRRYFKSEYCGKEWASFAIRVINEKARNPDLPAAIVPALWVAVEDENLPGVAKDIQFNHHELGDRYGKEGFWGIIKLSRYRDAYQMAVDRLAKRIVDVADNVQVGTARRLDLGTVQSAFGNGGSERNEMEFTVMAPDISSVPSGRDASYYGARPRDWKPYLPEIRLPISDYAEGLTHCLGCDANVGTISDHFENVDDGMAAPGLFIIDAWVTRNLEARQQLLRFDELNHPWTSLLLPWSKDDEEIAGSEKELREELAQCLGRKLADIPHQYQREAVDIKTLQEFADVLPKMAMKMRRRFLRNVPVPPGEGTAEGRFRLQGPSYDDPGKHDE
jgi:FxsC-like protein